MLIFLLILALTGSFLRPPLLIPIVRVKHSPIPFTTQYTSNTWNDKLRTIRYDNINKQWLLYTSEGFFQLRTLNDSPKRLTSAPPVSFMMQTDGLWGHLAVYLNGTPKQEQYKIFIQENLFTAFRQMEFPHLPTL